MVETSTKSLDSYICYPNGRSCNNFINEKAEAIYKHSITDREEYFAKQADEVYWHKKFTKTLDSTDKYLHRWFPDGEINICYNAVDRHV
jgi:hypothetical protein